MTKSPNEIGSRAAPPDAARPKPDPESPAGRPCGHLHAQTQRPQTDRSASIRANPSTAARPDVACSGDPTCDHVAEPTADDGVRRGQGQDHCHLEAKPELVETEYVDRSEEHTS